MTDIITDAQVDELLRQAEQRLQKGPKPSALVAAAAPQSAALKSQDDDSVAPPQTAVAAKEKLAVRVPQSKEAIKAQTSKVSDCALVGARDNPLSK